MGSKFLNSGYVTRISLRSFLREFEMMLTVIGVEFIRVTSFKSKLR